MKFIGYHKAMKRPIGISKLMNQVGAWGHHRKMKIGG